MQVVHERCCGLDVHKRTVVACVLVTAPDGRVTKAVRTFTTMTAGLLALSDWLHEQAVAQIAVESTGVFWRPVFNILEDGRAVTLVNAQHLKASPADYPHRQHGLRRRDGGGHRPRPPALRPASATG
jgi:hypothetical protein